MGVMLESHDEILEIQRRLKNTIRRIHQLAPMVGMAKQVREYDSDRRKNLLARYVTAALKAGEGVSAAEAAGRADPSYQAELEGLAAQRAAAERTIAEWEASFATYEAARSLHSMAKTTLSTLPE